jgi:hypothetical protein
MLFSIVNATMFLVMEDTSHRISHNAGSVSGSPDYEGGVKFYMFIVFVRGIFWIS